MNLLTPDEYAATYARLARAEANRDTVLGRLTAEHLTRELIPHSVRMDAETERLAALDQWADDTDTQTARLIQLNTDADALHHHRKQATAA